MSTYKAPAAAPNIDDMFLTEDTTFKTSPIPVHQAQAHQTNFNNLQSVFNDCLAAVKVSEQKRDMNQNQRFRYERNWERLRQAARNLAPSAASRGIKVMIPKYHPPINTEAEYFEVTATAQDGKYNETRGAESGFGLKGSNGAASPAGGNVDANGKLTAPVTLHGVTFPIGSTPPSV